ncbi:DNA phosphorothioation-dependent restriction protein dptg, partial [Globisporangium splendens]
MASNVAISKREFDEMDHESKTLFGSRLFVNQITMNGYSASVLLTRLKSETDSVKKKPKQTKTEEDMLNDEGRFLSSEYEAEALVATDPGMRSLCTAVSEGMKTKKKTMHGGRSPRQVGDGIVHSISTREYRHIAGMDKARFRYENLKKRKKHCSKAINSIKSYKTFSFEVYLWRLKIVWKHVSFLLEFCANNAFLKWRFFQSRMKEKTADVMAKRLVPIASVQVLAGYGDWSLRDGISGHASSPAKGFRKALKKQATVVPIDEYRTSKLCSDCHSPLDQALLSTKIKNNKVVLKKTRNVLRCATSSCKANFWNRGVNAARNILSLLKCKLLGLGRLEAFCRG